MSFKDWIQRAVRRRPVYLRSRWAVRTPAPRPRGKKSFGQSFVEFAILLPILLMMLSGLIEFGFLLNSYLDLIDTAREVARALANDDPLHDYNGNFQTSPLNPDVAQFYTRARNQTYQTLSNAGQIQLDPASDDLVISIFVVSGGSVTTRYPLPYTDPSSGCSEGGEWGWEWYCNYHSKLTTTDIDSKLSSLPNVPPDTGLVLVELFYNYHMVLGLPWIKAFVPDPVTLHAYSIMPNINAAPTPTP